MAVILALTPALLIGAAMIGAAAGWTDWRRGFGYVALDWSIRTAFLSIATSVAAVVLAGLTSFSRHWGPALLALSITAATFAASAVMHASGVTSPPL